MEKTAVFLLPIGPLTYFENWYRKAKPNEAWIRRYSESPDGKAHPDTDSKLVLNDTREFIKRSGEKVAVTRAFMKYGPQKIAIVLAITIMVLLSGFYWYDAAQKQNPRVIQKVRNESLQLMKSKEVGYDIKALPLLLEERYEPGFMMTYLSDLDTKARLSLALEAYKQMLLFDKHDKSKLKSDLINKVSFGFKELTTKKNRLSILNDRAE